MDKYGALLHEPWRDGEKPDSIEGFWAEDGNIFKLTVPEQLRDLIVDLQNALAKKYIEIERLKAELSKAKKSADELFR